MASPGGCDLDLVMALSAGESDAPFAVRYQMCWLVR
jgi:hypothetical protein